ncbi:MAG: gliding motility lipoprotein GldH [Bacteroidia bacterium]|nr:gliding motility lipoprotein GldH [Bacteroidia bacterium]
MRANLHSRLLLLSVVLVLFSCDSRRVYEEIKSIPGSSWNRNNILNFRVNVTDTVSVNNILIDIRNKSNYNFCNLFLFITIQSPDKKLVRDTIECNLADETGKWKGSGIGDIYNNKMLYKKNVKFPRAGVYTFNIEQAMRVENLEDISEVGIRIERTR